MKCPLKDWVWSPVTVGLIVVIRDPKTSSLASLLWDNEWQHLCEEVMTESKIEFKQTLSALASVTNACLVRGSCSGQTYSQFFIQLWKLVLGQLL